MEETNNSIKQIKLVTGEELLAEILTDTEDALVVKDVIKLQLDPYVETGSIDVRVFFIPWLILQSELCMMSINKSSIVALSIPEEDTIEQYYTCLEGIKKFNEESTETMKTKPNQDSDQTGNVFTFSRK